MTPPTETRIERRQEQHAHQEPQTAYEHMLNRNGLDCATYACWRPIAGFIPDVRRGEVGYCLEHIMALYGAERVTRWLER